MCLQYSRPPLLMPFFQMVRRRRTTRARPTLLIFRIDRPKARVSSSLVLYRALAVVLSLWRRDHNRKDSGENDDTWWYKTSSFFMTMQGLTPLLLSPTSCAAGDGRFWNFHPWCKYLHNASTILIRYESMRLRSFRQSEKTTSSDPVQHKRWTYTCYRAVNTKHQQRWTRRWCTTVSKHLAKRVK